MDGSLQSQLIALGVLMLPASILIATNHLWAGAACFVVALLVAVLLAWLQLRSAQQQHQRMMTYAQDTTNMGGDPTTVILALQGQPHSGHYGHSGNYGHSRHPGVPPELPPHQYDWRGYQQVRTPQAGEYRPPRAMTRP